MRGYENVDVFPPEEVVSFRDAETGASGVIVLHSTALGPAAGGCRLWRYGSDADMARDGMRLAEGMMLKNALAELPFGGGKAVLGEPTGVYDRRALFQAFGKAVGALNGRYITAEDVGTTVDDMAVVAGETRHVAGLLQRPGQPGGDPSPWTALGVFEAMRVAVRHRLGTGLDDVVVAVQGLGHVGFALCELLHNAGARLLIAEPRADVAAAGAVRFGAELMAGAALLGAKADVFAPCALGGVLDAAAVRNLRAKVVCGAANNQLVAERQAAELAERGILYAPDFLVNAGGIVNVAGEYLGWEEADVVRRVRGIGPRLARVIERAEADGGHPHSAAKAIALERVAPIDRLRNAA